MSRFARFCVVIAVLTAFAVTLFGAFIPVAGEFEPVLSAVVVFAATFAAAAVLATVFPFGASGPRHVDRSQPFPFVAVFIAFAAGLGFLCFHFFANRTSSESFRAGSRFAIEMGSIGAGTFFALTFQFRRFFFPRRFFFRKPADRSGGRPARRPSSM